MDHKAWQDEGYRFFPLRKNGIATRRSVDWKSDDIDVDTGADHNWGMALPPDVVAIQVEKGRGDQWWQEFRAEHNPGDPACIVDPSGCSSLLFNWRSRALARQVGLPTVEVKEVKLAPGVTLVSSTGGYLVVPPSTRQNEDYVGFRLEPENVLELPSQIAAVAVRRALLDSDDGIPEATRTRGFTDSANAERFAEAAQGLFLHVNTIGWMAYKSGVWRRDDLGEAMLMTKQVARRIHGEAKIHEREDAQKAARKWARTSEGAGKRNAMLRLAASEPNMSERADAFNTQDHLLNVQNGTLNLRTGELLPHHPSKHGRHSSIAAASYDADAECPAWNKFLNFAMRGDLDMLDFLQRFAGYCATADISEEVLAFFHGDGGAGKGTFLNTLRYVMGDYAITLAPDFFDEKGQEHKTELAQFYGVRLAVCGETKQGAALPDVKLKSMTGGENIRARYMGKDFFEFTMQAKMALSGNHRPLIADDSGGIWRRLLLIPFTHKPAQPDRQLKERLRAEADGILRWIADGARLWFEDGLVVPTSVREATDEYRRSEDLVGMFLEQCFPNPSPRVATDKLSEEWDDWCKREGNAKWSMRRVNKTLANRGIFIKKSGGERYYDFGVGGAGSVYH